MVTEQEILSLEGLKPNQKLDKRLQKELDHYLAEKKRARSNTLPTSSRIAQDRDPGNGKKNSMLSITENAGSSQGEKVVQRVDIPKHLSETGSLFVTTAE